MHSALVRLQEQALAGVCHTSLAAGSLVFVGLFRTVSCAWLTGRRQCSKAAWEGFSDAPSVAPRAVKEIATEDKAQKSASRRPDTQSFQELGGDSLARQSQLAEGRVRQIGQQRPSSIR